MLSVVSDGYTWDARNHLVSTLSRASFKYDPFGRRTAKTISGVTTSFLYDGLSPVQELSGTTVAANLLGGLGVDEHFTRTDSAGARNFLTDPLGSTLALADSAGTVQTSYTGVYPERSRREPFGNTTVTGQASANPYQYTGRENDGTGLYFYRARYYSPTLQRFTSEDPIGFRGGSANLYAYVGDAPTDLVDPTGTYDYFWHLYITYEAALAAGYSPSDAWNLAKEVADVDLRPGTQGADPSAANTHAMAGRKQSCQQAYEGTKSQIANDVSSDDIAKALHTIQEATAPAHRGYQPWNGGYTPLHLPGPGHFALDTVPSAQSLREAIDNSTRFLKDLAVRGVPLRDPSTYLPPSACGP